MIRATLPWIALTGILVSLVRCELPNSNSPENNSSAQNTGKLILNGSVTNTSDCKLFKVGDISAELPDTISCVEYFFNPDSNILLINHLNTGFNCCPESLYCSVSANGDTLIIQEYESAALCRCNCLYDIEIKIEGVEARSYQLKFIEPYSDEMEKLEFKIDLATAIIGSMCVTRKLYPWGISDIHEEPPDISGELLNHSDCKTYETALQTSMDISSGNSCVEYSYNSSTGSLTMRHINAAYNCCPEEISCTISNVGDTIYIQEVETAGLCDCLCLFDLDIQLEAILPTSYFVKFIEPYLNRDEKMEFEINLQDKPSGSYCVTREEYPWGL